MWGNALCRVAFLLLLLPPAFPQAPALVPSPAQESTSTRRCRTCPAAAEDEALSLSLDVLAGTDVAQFYSYAAEGSILVYFAARAVFSNAPAQLKLADFRVENGSVLEIFAESVCTDFLLKGSVQQRAAWTSDTTDINIKADYGVTRDCRGRPFPAVEASYTSRNGPIGSFYAAGMSYTASGPVTAAATNFVRLAFSEPVTGLSIDQFNVTLAAAPDLSGTSQDTQILAPAGSPSCIPAYQSQVLPAVRNSSQFYNVFITVPDCFYGLVRIGFIGQVLNTVGARSLPIKPIGFNRVAARIPVAGGSAYEQLPALGSALQDGCT